MKKILLPAAAFFLFSASFPGTAQQDIKAGNVVSNSKEIIVEYSDPAKPLNPGDRLTIPDSRGNLSAEVICVSPGHAKCRILSGAGTEQTSVARGASAFYGRVSAERKTGTKTVGGVEFVFIPGGSYEMGVNYPDEKNYYLGENIKHTVSVSSFWMSRYEITQAQYSAVMKSNPSDVKGDSLPVQNVNWFDASAFCEKFNGRNGTRARIPYEAEWEYAARAGTKSIYYWGDEINGDFCWYSENSGESSHPAGEKKPNRWGLYDMSGNVCEWVADWYDESYYRSSPSSDPHGAASGSKKILRGGSYVNLAMHPCPMRVDIRIVDTPDKKSEGWGAFGIRLVLPE